MDFGRRAMAHLWIAESSRLYKQLNSGAWLTYEGMEWQSIDSLPADEHVHPATVPDSEDVYAWLDDAIALTPCGCRVEPDGHCVHGNPSWLILLELI